MKKLIHRLFLPILIAFMATSFLACNGFLEEKPYKYMVVPKKLEDLQTLLDNHALINGATPALLEGISDNYYTTEAFWLSALDEVRLNYNWEATAEAPSGWNNLYRAIYMANVALDMLPDIDRSPGDQQEYDQIRGTALFYRAFHLFTVAQLWCRPYSATSATDPGIPLRLTAAIETKSVRGTVAQTYKRILDDLKEAADILPNVVEFPTRPGKAAAYGTLARVYLSMGYYEEAGHYADLSLREYDVLVDYNTVQESTAPFRRFNPEVIYYDCMGLTYILLNSGTRGRVDTLLYRSYDEHDLRKKLFFQPHVGVDDGSFFFRGSYDGDFSPRSVFYGITTGEMYLTRAESRARNGDFSGAMADLNMLLENRWSNTEPYTGIVANNVDEALDVILTERRKELVFRGLRWMDVRRMNREGAGISFSRKLGDKTYHLPPNDPRWVLMIPDEVINLSGMLQNVR